MTLGIENDVLLYKVFPANLHGLTLSWFHHLPQNSINSFRDFSEAFFGHYLCSACQKKNISTLQNIKMQENKSLRDFMKRFEQAVLVTNWPTKNNKDGSSKPLNNQSKQGEWKQDRREQQPLRLTPLIVSYEQLLSLIQELPKFKWSELIKTDLARRDWKR
ncbi:hypothetical protein CK203_102327 [Vitis vinifera]|uniref:Retrotransposon gag domain-containing protein n=1 Tax=Vitis vinifera TaxID=29760 RepID=A0A438BRC0_VITVI|nr:hypothetical protein CK203_102327 [Vitis vinifera]